ncbi:MAG: response regulator [Rhizobacter sp.]|nr:response regulator [Bacteriovorax sp.]
MKKIINIALCMIERNDAQILGAQLLSMDFYVTIHYCYSLSELSECLLNNQINCFVFDATSKKYKTLEIVNKLRNSSRFRDSSIIFITDTDKENSFQYFNFKTDIMVPRPFLKEDYALYLSDLWNKQLYRIIPENLNILILDNNPEILEVLGLHMQELKHKNFVTCQSVKEAKNKLIEQEFDLLLLDWDLEDGTCLEIIDFARSQSSSKRINEAVTIVITGRNDVDDIMTLVQMNVKDHIIKPFDYMEFEDKIYYAIERHQRRVS